MMELVLQFYDISLENLSNLSIDDLVKLPVRERIGRFKYIKIDKIKQEYDEVLMQLKTEIHALAKKEGA